MLAQARSAGGATSKTRLDKEEWTELRGVDKQEWELEAPVYDI